MRTGLRYLLCSAVIAPALAAAPASAVTFNLINTGGAEVGTQARQGFEIAAAYWSSVLTNNSVVNLNIGFASLGTGILGSTGSTRADVNLSTIVAAMNATGNSALDASALAVLNAQTVGGTINAITSGPRNASTNGGVDTNVVQWDNDGSENNNVIWANTSVLRAMGITYADYFGEDISNVVDGSVTFSSNFNWDFNPTDGITSGLYDFIGVAVHEIGHALGFVSGVDLYDVYGYPSGPSRTSGVNLDFDNIGGGLMSTLDLFRYSNDVLNVAPGVGPALDWSVARPTTIAAGGNPYFSIDGGVTQLFGDSRFSTGRYNGDGQQASHWKDKGGCSGQIGIMDPNFCNAQMGEVTASDLAAFDAMGWNINFDVLTDPTYVKTTSQMYSSFVPEPGTWLQMIAGFALLGGVMRSSKRVRRSIAFA